MVITTIKSNWLYHTKPKNRGTRHLATRQLTIKMKMVWPDYGTTSYMVSNFLPFNEKFIYK